MVHHAYRRDQALYVPRQMVAPACFFFNDTATTEIYTLSLHDALPICARGERVRCVRGEARDQQGLRRVRRREAPRSEEHTSELQPRVDLVCRLLLEKKKKSRGSCANGPKRQGRRAEASTRRRYSTSRT